MRVITCAGYYRTGSSAISDFFKEFDSCHSLGDMEFRFVQDPDGISDLEYNLVENPHRHNSSFAIKRFLKMSKFNDGNLLSKRYFKYFGPEYKRLTKKYVDDLTTLKCKTWWHRDQIEKGLFFYWLDRVYSKICSCVVSKYQENLSLSCQNDTGYYSQITKEDFYYYTKKYTSSLIELVSEGKPFVLLDQLVPPTNAQRYLNYFDDIKIIIVDRDPRDLFYIENKYYRWGIIPYQNVADFCKWYKITRTQSPSEDSTSVMSIRFEDLIYKYDLITRKIINFCGLQERDHVRKKQFFNPDLSKKHIREYINDQKMLSNIRYIEKELPEFCYENPKE